MMHLNFLPFLKAHKLAILAGATVLAVALVCSLILITGFNYPPLASSMISNDSQYFIEPNGSVYHYYIANYANGSSFKTPFVLVDTMQGGGGVAPSSGNATICPNNCSCCLGDVGYNDAGQLFCINDQGHP